MTAVVVALAGCGGGDDDSAPAAAEPAAQPADPPAEGDDETGDDDVEAAEPAAAAPTASDLADNTAVVTIGDQTYEFDVTPGAIQRCDPDFFGAFWALGRDAAGNGIELLLPPKGDPNFEDAPYVKIGDEALDAEWVANPDQEMAGVEPGESQIDSFTVDGRHASGTATFVDLNATYAFQGGGEEPQPITGTFEVLCAES